jgi:hypothetical protein
VAALNAGRALLQARKQGALADIKACTARVLATRNVKEINPPMKMAMGAAAYGGHTNSLRHLRMGSPLGIAIRFGKIDLIHFLLVRRCANVSRPRLLSLDAVPT